MMMTEELWTTTQVAEYLGYDSRDSVYMWLHRAGIKPVSRQPGKSGENLYRAEDIRRG